MYNLYTCQPFFKKLFNFFIFFFNLYMYIYLLHIYIYIVYKIILNKKKPLKILNIYSIYTNILHIIQSIKYTHMLKIKMYIHIC